MAHQRAGGVELEDVRRRRAAFARRRSRRETDLRARDDRFKGMNFARTANFVSMLDAAAKKVGVPTAALAIGWVCSRPGITAAIAGAKTPAQVTENVRAAAMLDNEKFWAVIDKMVNAHKF